jgi:hypothetical protein
MRMHLFEDSKNRAPDASEVHSNEDDPMNFDNQKWEDIKIHEIKT